MISAHNNQPPASRPQKQVQQLGSGLKNWTYFCFWWKLYENQF